MYKVTPKKNANKVGARWAMQHCQCWTAVYMNNDKSKMLNAGKHLLNVKYKQ